MRVLSTYMYLTLMTQFEIPLIFKSEDVWVFCKRLDKTIRAKDHIPILKFFSFPSVFIIIIKLKILFL